MTRQSTYQYFTLPLWTDDMDPHPLWVERLSRSGYSALPNADERTESDWSWQEVAVLTLAVQTLPLISWSERAVALKARDVLQRQTDVFPATTTTDHGRRVLAVGRTAVLEFDRRYTSLLSTFGSTGAAQWRWRLAGRAAAAPWEFWAQLAAEIAESDRPRWWTDPAEGLRFCAVVAALDSADADPHALDPLDEILLAPWDEHPSAEVGWVTPRIDREISRIPLADRWAVTRANTSVQYKMWRPGADLLYLLLAPSRTRMVQSPVDPGVGLGPSWAVVPIEVAQGLRTLSPMHSFVDLGVVEPASTPLLISPSPVL